MRNITFAALLGATLICPGAGFAQEAAPTHIEFSIDRQPLRDALRVFAKQAGMQVLRRDEDVSLEGMTAPNVTGVISAEQALKQLLANTQLKYEFINERTVRISSALEGAYPVSMEETKSAGEGSVRLAQTDTSSVGSGSPASGQEAEGKQNNPDADESSDGVMLEEVVVTAQKRRERLIDVPMSITAISGEKLSAAGVNSALDLSFAVPGLSVQESGPGRQTIVIRGIASALGISSLTGLYLDEIPLSGIQDGFQPSYADVRAIDLDRVEVLKGPQGTLFGEGAAGGVIRYITKDPNLSRLGGEMSAALSNTSDGGWSEVVTGVANVPIANDVFGLRVAATYDNKSGWIDQPSIGRKDINDSALKHVRVKALYAPSPELHIKATAEIHRNKGGGSNLVNQQPRKDSNFLQGFDRSAPTNYVDDYDLFNLTVTYDFGIAELLSSTSHARLESLQSFTQLVGQAPTPWLEILTSLYPQDATNLSQEFRLTSVGDRRVKWTIGANYKDSELTSGLGGFGAVIFGGAVILPPNPDIIAGTRQTESWAGFVDASILTLDRLEVGGGLRYFGGKDESFTPGAVPRNTLSSDFSKTTFRAFVKYAVSQDANVYGSVGTGFRSGAALPAFVRDLGGPSSFGPENSLFYELGTKVSLLNGRVKLAAALFYGEYRDMLEDRLIRSPVNGGLLQYTANGQGAKLKGIEWDIGWAVTDRLALSLSGDVTHSKITKLDPTDDHPGYSLGDPINLSPKYGVSVGGDYRFQWRESVPGFILLSFNRQGKSYYSDRSNFLLLETQDVAPVVNFLDASVSAEWNGWKWSVSGRNLLDESGAINAAATGWTAQARPRTVGISVSKGF